VPAPALVVVLEVVVVAAAVVAVLVGLVDAARPVGLVGAAVGAVRPRPSSSGSDAAAPWLPEPPGSTERSLPEGCWLSSSSTTFFAFLSTPADLAAATPPSRPSTRMVAATSAEPERDRRRSIPGPFQSGHALWPKADKRRTT
jgi:hypothetical protein